MGILCYQCNFVLFKEAKYEWLKFLLIRLPFQIEIFLVITTELYMKQTVEIIFIIDNFQSRRISVTFIL